MLYNKTVLLGSMAAAMTLARPALGAPAGLVVLGKETVENGTLIIYGDESFHGADGLNLVNRSIDSPPSTLTRRCGSTQLKCNGENYIPSAACAENLISSIRATSSNGLQDAPRSICLQGNFGFCCISWADPVYGATRGVLINAAQATLDGCVHNGQSGLTRDTSLGSTCTTQCLSSDANT